MQVTLQTQFICTIFVEMSKGRGKHKFEYTKSFLILSEMVRRRCYTQETHVKKSELRDYYGMNRSSMTSCVNMLVSNKFICYSARGGKMWLTDDGINKYAMILGKPIIRAKTKICAECNQEFEIHVDKESNFCSVECVELHYERKIKKI